MTAKKRVSTVIITLIIICALAGGGFLLYKQFSGGASSRSEKVFVQKVSTINTVTGADLFSNSFAGVIVAQKSVDVKYDTTKTIDELLVSDGDSVKKGDKVLTYNVEAIQIEIDAAKLEVEKLENSITTNENEIKQLEEEKKTASQDAAVSYTTQILSLQSDNARSEYDIKTKNVEIQKLEASLKNAYVIAPIDGTVKDIKENAGAGEDYSENADVIMKITADGNYRVKGIFNENNSSQIYNGAPVILKSRVDDTQWKGTVSEIDTNPQQSSGYEMYSMGESDEQTSSSKYAFYVEPDSLDGFMLGQHIIIEIDNGQSEQIEKTGIWLYSDFILDDGGKSYVWAKNDKDKIEKRYVEIGQKDDEYGDWEIKSGLETDDYIAYPESYIEEGMTSTTNQSDKDIPDNNVDYTDEFDEYGEDYYEDDDGMFDDGMTYDENGNAIFTDEEGNTIVNDSDGSTIITSPDGGRIVIDIEGNFIEGNIDDEGNFVFSYDGEETETDSTEEDNGENTEENNEENTEKEEISQAEEPQEPITFEELYGISEEELDAMSTEEKDEFFKKFYGADQ